MSWIEDIQGLTTVLDAAGSPVQRRSVIQFTDVSVTDDGTKTVVGSGGGGSPASITGLLAPNNQATTNAVLNSIVAALVAKGIAVDNRA